MRRHTLLTATTILVGALLVTTACGDSGEGGDDAIAVVTTTSILGDLTRQLAGDCAAVEVLVPPGTDPHERELSARDAAGLREADLVLQFGLGLEESLQDVLDAAAQDGVPLVSVSQDVDTIPLGDSSTPDPHVWQDPRRTIAVVGSIAGALTTHTSCPAEAVRTAAQQLTRDLEALDGDLEAQYATLPAERRVLVTNHDSLGYLAERYDFELVGAVIPGGSTLAEPSAGELADLVAQVDEHDVPAVFAETTDTAQLVEALAAEADHPVAVVELYTDSLGPEGSDADSYEGLMRTNAALIVDALGGDPP